MNLALDIETVKDTNITTRMENLLLDRVKGRAGTEDPIKIERQIKEKQEKITSEYALNPLTCQICCIAVQQSIDKRPEVFTDRDEEVILRDFKSWTEKTFGLDRLPRLITFNGKEFDVPVLAVRTAYHSIRLHAVQLSISTYQDSWHYDVRLALTGHNKYKLGTLTEWCELFGIDLNSGDMTAEQIQTFFDNNELDRITNKCVADVEATLKLFERTEGFLNG